MTEERLSALSLLMVARLLINLALFAEVNADEADIHDIHDLKRFCRIRSGIFKMRRMSEKYSSCGYLYKPRYINLKATYPLILFIRVLYFHFLTDAKSADDAD